MNGRQRWDLIAPTLCKPFKWFTNTWTQQVKASMCRNQEIQGKGSCLQEEGNKACMIAFAAERTTDSGLKERDCSFSCKVSSTFST